MNNYISEHQERKNKVLDFLNDGISFFESQNDENTVKNLTVLKENVEKGLFSIVIVGEFSTGKSTFLNALMGKKILPSFSKETTATVNYLRHTSEAPNGEKGIVYYKNGKTEILPSLDVDVIEKVVSTRGDKDVVSDIAHVDLYLDSKFLENGVVLVDSPGLNGIKEGLGEITLNQIKQSYASIFMFNCEQPGSKSNFEILKDVKENSNSIFFILNKIDGIKVAEGETVESVIRSLKKSYNEVFPDDTMIPEIWPISAADALYGRDKNYFELSVEKGDVNGINITQENLLQKSRMEAFEERLWRYLTLGEKTKAELLEPVQRNLNLLERQKDILVERKGNLESNLNEKEVDAQKAHLEKEIADLKAKSEKVNIDAAIFSKFKENKESLNSQLQKIIEKLAQEVDDNEYREELIDLAQDVDKRIDSEIKRAIFNTNDSLQENLNELIQIECNEYLVQLNNEFAEIAGKNEFKVKINPIESIPSNDARFVEKYENDIKKIEQQLVEIKVERRKINSKLQQALANENERQRLIDEIALLDAKKDNFINQLNDAPRLETREVQAVHTRDREGLFGKIAQIFVGKKRERGTDIITIGEKEREDYIKEKNNRIKETEEKLAQKESKMEKYMNLESSEAVKIEKEEIEELKKELEEQKRELQEELKEKIKKVNEKDIKKIKRRIKSHIETEIDDIRSDVQKYKNAQQRTYLNKVKEIINVNILNELQTKEQELTALKEDLQKNKEARIATIDEINQKLSVIETLVNVGTALKENLEIELTDQIKMEEI